VVEVENSSESAAHRETSSYERELGGVRTPAPAPTQRMLDTSLAELPLDACSRGGINGPLIPGCDRTLLPRHKAEMPPLMEAVAAQAQQTMRLHPVSAQPLKAPHRACG